MSDLRPNRRAGARGINAGKCPPELGLLRYGQRWHEPCDLEKPNPFSEDPMQKVRWWTTSLISRIDWMVSQVENHESIAQSAIREVRQSAARAHVQLGRVKRDGEQLRRRAIGAREGAVSWRERASACSTDEERALECLRRARREARRADELERRLAEHERVEKQLSADVARIGERLSELRERHNLLRTRQSRAHALATVRGVDTPMCGDAGELFERWETHVAERELAGEVAVGDDPILTGDSFAEEFDAREENEALRAELRELRAGAGSGTPDRNMNAEDSSDV
jgi:phage shock protein A